MKFLLWCNFAFHFLYTRNSCWETMFYRLNSMSKCTNWIPYLKKAFPCMEVLLNDTLRLYVSWFSLTVSSDMSPTTSTTTMKANFDASITLEPLYFNEGPSDCKNMFVVTGFRYIEVLFRLEPKGFPIFYSVLLQRRRKHVQHPTNPGVRVKDYTISWKSA